MKNMEFGMEKIFFAFHSLEFIKHEVLFDAKEFWTFHRFKKMMPSFCLIN